jgi:hypothetical protein
VVLAPRHWRCSDCPGVTRPSPFDRLHDCVSQPAAATEMSDLTRNRTSGLIHCALRFCRAGIGDRSVLSRATRSRRGSLLPVFKAKNTPPVQPVLVLAGKEGHRRATALVDLSTDHEDGSVVRSNAGRLPPVGDGLNRVAAKTMLGESLIGGCATSGL